MLSSAAVYRLLRRVWGGAGLGVVAARAAPSLPDRLARRLERLRLAVRVKSGERLVDERELEALYRRALERLAGRPAGDYLEFGVYVGTSMACMHRASQAAGLPSMRLIGFDSFQGLPDTARDEDGGHWAPGMFASDLEFTLRHLEALGVDLGRVTLVPGWYAETLTDATRARHGIERASVIMVDCDLASSARAALEFAAPAIVDEAVVVFDDWHAGGLSGRGLGERRAFEDFLAAHPELRAEELAAFPPHGVAFVVARRDEAAAP